MPRNGAELGKCLDGRKTPIKQEANKQTIQGGAASSKQPNTPLVGSKHMVPNPKAGCQ
jgi:hypothetical protein